MEKKKVLIVAHHFTIGGSQKSLIEALNVIDYEKNDVILYVRKNRLTLLPLVNKNVNVVINDDKTHYYRKPLSIYYQLIALLSGLVKNQTAEKKYTDKLSAYIRREMKKYELKHYFVETHYDIGIVYIQGYTADILSDGINADKKYVFYHISTDEAHEFHEEAFKKFDKIIAVSENVKNILQNELYPNFADKIVVLNNYVNPNSIRTLADEYSIDKPLGKTVLCSCGRFSPVKGFDLAVKSAEILKKKGIDFVWYFVGDGPDREMLEKMVSDRGLEDNIVITGMKDNPYPYIKECDFYVQPSYEESFGLTIKEALILNKCIVSTKTAGALGQLQNRVNGLLTDINEEALANGIIDLISNDKAVDAIQSYLEGIDYSEEEQRYKKDWKKLLKN